MPSAGVIMDTRNIRNAEDAQQCLLAIQQSGLSLVAWSRTQGIKAASLNAWRTTLLRTHRLPRLVEVTPLPPLPAPSFILHVAHFSLEIPPSFDAASLARLLPLLRAC